MKKVLDRLEEGLIALLLAAMTATTFSNVVARYIFESNITWALELSEFLFAWLIFLGMSYGVKVGSHIGVDALVKLFPRSVQRFVGLIGAAACIAYSLIVLKGGYDYVAKVQMIGIYAQDLPIPRWIPLTVLPIGFALLSLRFLQAFIRIAMGKQTGLGLADEAADALKLDASHQGGRP